MPRKKKQHRPQDLYFNQTHEDAIRDYNALSEDDPERIRLFNEIIEPGLRKIAEETSKRWKASYVMETEEGIQDSLVSQMGTNLHKIKYARGAAFAYLTVICKNYIYSQNGKEYKASLSHVTIGSDEGEINEGSISMDTTAQAVRSDLRDFILEFAEYLKQRIPALFVRDADARTAMAVVDIMSQYEDLNPMTRRSFNVYMREILGENEQNSNKMQKVMKKLQEEKRRCWEHYCSYGEMPPLDDEDADFTC